MNKNHEFVKRQSAGIQKKAKKIVERPTRAKRLALRCRQSHVLRSHKSIDGPEAMEKLARSGLRRLAAGLVLDERPGDVVVSRDFRAVYLVHTDGSRRRCLDEETRRRAIDVVRGKLR